MSEAHHHGHLPAGGPPDPGHHHPGHHHPGHQHPVQHSPAGHAQPGAQAGSDAADPAWGSPGETRNGDPRVAAAAGEPARRPAVPSRRLAVLLILVGGLLVILASTRTWASIGLQDLTGSTHLSVAGRKAAPSGLPVALAALAGMFVLVTAGRVIRMLVGVALVVGGLFVALNSIQVSTNAMSALTGQLRSTLGLFASNNALGTAALTALFDDADPHVTFWPWVAAGGGALVALAGLVVLLRGLAWPGPAQRFERQRSSEPAGAATRPVAVTDSPAGTWDALSRGEDPT